MDGATISNDTISQVQKQADAFDIALRHASEKVLGVEIKKQTRQLDERSDNRAAQHMQQGC